MDQHEIKLVEMNSKKDLLLNHKELELILMRPEFADKHLYIVSVAGTYRKGKSFLLNYFLRYLIFGKNAVNKFGPQHEPLRGFKWGAGTRRVTNGINLWSEPQIVQRDDGEQVVVLLMDTEGTNDMRNNMKVDIRIFALSLAISNIQIYSLGGQFGSSDLEYLRLFTDFAKMLLQDADNAAHLQSLIFLIRDWIFPSECAYGFEGGEKMFDQVIKDNEEDEDCDCSNYSFLNENFSSVKTFLLPHPGEQIGSTKFNGSVEQLSPKYVEYLQKLCHTVFNPSTLVVKHMNNRPITCANFVIWLKQYARLFQSKEPPTKASVHESIAKASLEENLRDCIKAYEEKMEKDYLDKGDFTDKGQLTDAHEKALAETIDRFQRMDSLGGAAYMDEYVVKLRHKLAESYQHLERSFSKTLEANKQLQLMSFIETKIQKFQQLAHETATNYILLGKTSQELRAELEQEAIRIKLDIEQKAVEENMQIEKKNFKEIETFISNLVEDELKLFKKMKTVTGDQIVLECLSMYQKKMNEVMDAAKQKFETLDFASENQKAIDTTLQHFGAKVSDYEAEQTKRLKSDLMKMLTDKTNDYREQFSWIIETYAANVNDAIIEESMKKYKESTANASLEKSAMDRFDNLHKECSQTIASSFESKVRGHASMKRNCRINLHTRLVRCYFESHPALSSDSEWNNRTVAIQQWHEQKFLDGEKGILKEFRNIKTNIPQTVVEKRKKSRCLLL